MKGILLSLALVGTLAGVAPAALSLKIMSPSDQSFTLRPNESAQVYGTITGVDGHLESWSFTASSASGMGGDPTGASFAIADDGTMESMGYYMAHDAHTDFSGLLGTITATGSSGVTYTNVLTVFDPTGRQTDGENLSVRVTSAQPTPEPSALAALGIGGLSMLHQRRSLRKAVK